MRVLSLGWMLKWASRLLALVGVRYRVPAHNGLFLQKMSDVGRRDTQLDLTLIEGILIDATPLPVILQSNRMIIYGLIGNAIQSRQLKGEATSKLSRQRPNQ